MSQVSTTLVVGRGKLYFDPFVSGTRQKTGEMYLGNTPAFQLNRKLDSVRRFSSVGGRKIERESLTLADENTATFTTDHVDMENVALWFGSSESSDTLAAINKVTRAITVLPGRHYQLGDDIRAQGIRNVDNVSVAVSSVDLAETNFEVDLVNGRVYIPVDAPDITEETVVDVTYEWRETGRAYAESATAVRHGALRFISTNPVGPKKHYYFPFVEISPRGNMDLKGDGWQQMMFDVAAYRLSGAVEAVYVDEVISTGLLEDEQAIVDDGMTLAEFPYYEDILDQITNTDLPEALT